jgi:hypothetical protein
MRKVELAPHTRVSVEDEFFSISSVHVQKPTDARVGIRDEVRKETHVISPMEWSNIWVYGSDIFLAGYISWEEFRRHAQMIAEGSHVFQYTRTKTKNLGVPVSRLKPLADLFLQVSAWQADKTNIKEWKGKLR